MGSIKGLPRGKYKAKKDKANTTDRVSCSNCSKCFKRRVILEHHIKTKHLNYRALCPMCNQKFVSKSVCVRHLKVVHKIGNHTKLDIAFTNNERSVPMDTFSFESHKSFPSMSNAVIQVENKHFEIHIKANRDINEGEFLVAASAFASIEFISGIGHGCFQCGKSGTKIQCPFCIDVWFCSEKCSQSKFHRKNCNPNYINEDCKIVRLVIEMINVAFKSVNDVKSLLDFCCGILFHNRKSKNCLPLYAQYGEILQLKGKPEDKHHLISKRALK